MQTSRSRPLDLEINAGAVNRLALGEGIDEIVDQGPLCDGGAR